MCERIYPERGWPALKLRCRLGWRMWRHPQVYGTVRTLYAHSPWREVAQAHPRSYRKVFNDYPFSGLRLAQRADWLQTHCRLTTTLFGDEVLPAILHRCDAPLCRVALPGGHGLLHIRLIHAHQFEREGDLSLLLEDPFGTPLFLLSFSFEQDAQGLGLVIGGLQGRLGLDTARQLTKFCLGVRPPNLLLFALQTLARELGLVRIRAVGAARHVYHGTERAGRVRFDYDGFWPSAGGVMGEDQFYHLPLQPQRREREDIPANKRAQYQRRYAWLDGLEQDMVDWIARVRRVQPAQSSGPAC